MIDKSQTIKNKIFTKYRDFKNDYTWDILKNKRLWAAEHKDLNDLEEGDYYYYSNKINIDYVKRLKEIKNKFNVCSFSYIRKYNAPMWAHYADNNQGIAIKFKITDADAENIRKVEYKRIENFTPSLDLEKDAKEILFHKNHLWKYENEYRILTKKQYVNIEIKEIVFGKKINPCLKEQIKHIFYGEIAEEGEHQDSIKLKEHSNKNTPKE